MLKSLCGGGAAVGALLLASLNFYAHSSVAETLAAAVQETPAPIEVETASAQEIEPVSVSASLAALRRDATVEVRPELNVLATLFSASEKPKANKLLGPTRSFVATAYALRGRTAGGQVVRRGLIAADRKVLPLGSRVRVDAGSYSGEYTVADSGSAVRGRKIDIWMPSNGEATRFGRRKVKLTVLSYGGRRPRRP